MNKESLKEQIYSLQKFLVPYERAKLKDARDEYGFADFR